MALHSNAPVFPEHGVTYSDIADEKNNLIASFGSMRTVSRMNSVERGFG
jgi:hypothetical protein